MRALILLALLGQCFAGRGQKLAGKYCYSNHHELYPEKTCIEFIDNAFSYVQSNHTGIVAGRGTYEIQGRDIFLHFDNWNGSKIPFSDTTILQNQIMRKEFEILSRKILKIEGHVFKRKT